MKMKTITNIDLAIGFEYIGTTRKQLRLEVLVYTLQPGDMRKGSSKSHY